MPNREPRRVREESGRAKKEEPGRTHRRQLDLTLPTMSLDMKEAEEDEEGHFRRREPYKEDTGSQLHAKNKETKTKQTLCLQCWG